MQKQCIKMVEQMASFVDQHFIRSVNRWGGTQFGIRQSKYYVFLPNNYFVQVFFFKNHLVSRRKNIFQIAGVVTITSAILACLHNPKHSPETEHNLRVIMCNSVYSICSSFLFPHQSHQFVFISWLSGYQGAFSILVENSISQTIMFCIM